MSRADMAYLILMLLVVCSAVVLIQTRRFANYQRSVLRGNRQARPVSNPFWLP